MTAQYAFNKYYSKTDETSVYAAAMILHPSCQKQYIKYNWKQAQYTSFLMKVKKLQETKYKDKVSYNPVNIEPDREPDVYDLWK